MSGGSPSTSRQVEDDGESSSDSLRVMNAQLKQEGRVAQSFLEHKWASMQKKLKKSSHRESRHGRRRRHDDEDRHRSSRGGEDDDDHRADHRSSRGEDRHARRSSRDEDATDDRSSRRERHGHHRTSHRRRDHGEHDNRMDSPPRRRHRHDGDGGRHSRPRHEERGDESQRRRVPCLLANVPATRDGRIDNEHRPAYLTDEVIRHAEEIQRRRRVWQRGREREERHKAAEEKEILAAIRDGDETGARKGQSLHKTYTTGEARSDPAATSFVPSTSNPEPPSDTAALKWSALSTSVSGGSEQQDKFRKLMGIKPTMGPHVQSTDMEAVVEANKATYVLSSLEEQYAVGRRNQLSRGTGLGFSSASSWLHKL